MDSHGALSGILSVVPNPSAGQVLIRYQISKPGPVTIEIFDADGALVRRIAEGWQMAGAYDARWDGRDDAGKRFPAGVYLTRFETAGGVTTGKVTLAK